MISNSLDCLQTAPAFHLRDPKASNSLCNAVSVLDEHTLINLGLRLLERIDQLRRYRACPELPERHAGLRTLAWVRLELESTSSDISYEQFKARVAELAEKEDRLWDSLESELISLASRPAPASSPRQHTSSSSPMHPYRTCSSGPNLRQHSHTTFSSGSSSSMRS
jgi:hypothetical protein